MVFDLVDHPLAGMDFLRLRTKAGQGFCPAGIDLLLQGFYIYRLGFRFRFVLHRSLYLGNRLAELHLPVKQPGFRFLLCRSG